MMSAMIPYEASRLLGNSPVMRGLFDDNFFRPFFGLGSMEEMGSIRVDIKDEGDHYLLSADLPGASKDQIELSVDNGVMTIAAHMNSEKKEEKDGYVCSERRYGRVERSFKVDSIEQSGITAQYTDGVLRVTLPKKADSAADGRQRIEIQ